jgi:hypothetical protein
MNRFRVLCLSAVLSVATLLVAAGAVAATTTRGCDTHLDQQSFFSGSHKSASSNSYLSDVQAKIDHQALPLCQGPTSLSPSMSSAWVMITPAVSGQYIQYGFWNCAIGCGVNCCSTGGQVHEFLEYNGASHVRRDLGNLADGQYVMDLKWFTHRAPCFR